MAVKVLVAEDHSIMRQGLVELLEGRDDMEVVGDTGDGEAAVELAGRLKPDVVVMDVSMPKMDGIEATRRIIAHGNGTRIVALSMHSRKRFLLDMLHAGALGYVLKSHAFSERIAAIKAAVKGEFYLCTETTSVFIDEDLHGPDQSRGAKDLSVRERKVVELLAGGKSSKEIAYDLDLSVKTVDACRRKLMKKLDIDSVADIVKYAIREGLSSLDTL